MIKVQQMTSPKSGRPVANQFILTDDSGHEYFQSYDSIIAKRIDNGVNGVIYLDETYWDYSRTTSKYRNEFLMENTAETKKKIKSGEYILTDLN